MKRWQQAILNAGIMAGLSAIPIWIAYETVDYTMVKAVGGTFLLTFLTLSARYFKPPETDMNDNEIKTDDTETQAKPGIILGHALNLMWV